MLESVGWSASKNLAQGILQQFRIFELINFLKKMYMCAAAQVEWYENSEVESLQVNTKYLIWITQRVGSIFIKSLGVWIYI